MTVADTVVLRYFVGVDQTELLVAAVGQPILIPTMVFDPTDQDESETMQSELRRGIAHHRRRSVDETLEREVQEEAAAVARRLSSLDELCAQGVILVDNMTNDEIALYSRLVDKSLASGFGLALGLHGGEAACVAMAIERGFVLATDDNDALRVFRSLNPDGEYIRIRGILRAGAEQGLISEEEANQIHDQMRMSGFWDTERPFPT